MKGGAQSLARFKSKCVSNITKRKIGSKKPFLSRTQSQMVSTGTQTDKTEDSSIRYGLIKHRLSIILHTALCKIRRGLRENGSNSATVFS